MSVAEGVRRGMASSNVDPPRPVQTGTDPRRSIWFSPCVPWSWWT